MYCLPKIHKSKIINEAIRTQNTEIITVHAPHDLKIRPIIAGPACPTHRLSHLLDQLLRPLVQYVEANLRDSLDMLSRLPQKLEGGNQLSTFDVNNLYGNISHSLGLTAIDYWLNLFPLEFPRFSKQFIIDALCIILKNNNFYFNGKHYRQLKGTAMGTKVAPVYATLCLSYLEKSLYTIIESKYGPFMKDFFINNYFRFLDDVFIIFDSELISVDCIDSMLNNLDPHLTFNLEKVGSMVNFFDIAICLTDGNIESDIFFKATDSKQYLDFLSHHPLHVKRALPYNLFRRICTIVSDEERRAVRMEEMKQSLLKCNYPEQLINDDIKKANSLCRYDLIHSTKASFSDKKENNIVYVSSYNANYDNNQFLIRNCFQKLKEHEPTYEIFNKFNVLFSKRQPPNLKSILTNARLEVCETGEVNMCNKARCQLCSIIITGNHLIFQPTNFKFLIKSNMTCDTLNCIYAIKCQGCEKMYIGETNNLRLRTNVHRDHASKNMGLVGVSRHIYECTKAKPSDKNFKNVKFLIMPFYKLQSDDVATRRSMEKYFINKFSPALNET